MLAFHEPHFQVFAIFLNDAMSRAPSHQRSVSSALTFGRLSFLDVVPRLSGALRLNEVNSFDVFTNAQHARYLAMKSECNQI